MISDNSLKPYKFRFVGLYETMRIGFNQLPAQVFECSFCKARSVKILLTVDPEIPVPPTEYGGIERIVDSLISEYSRLGHDVYLIANASSDARNALQIFGWPALHSRGVSNIVANAIFLKKVYSQLNADVIHSFSRLLYLYPLVVESRLRVLQSYQRAISEKSTAVASTLFGSRLLYTSCGKHMINGHLSDNRFYSIHNFTDTGYFSPRTNNSVDKCLVYLGRIEEIKGTKEAIDVALATGKKLIIAGNIQPGHDDYFERHVRPHFDNPLISYIGPVNDEQKLHLLQNASALLFPIKWEEPFGIVMVEAMACGTPVIGFNRGSVPEVIVDGKTGYVVNTVEEMIAAVGKIHRIDRNDVRKDCLLRFSRQVIAQQYISLFSALIAVN